MDTIIVNDKEWRLPDFIRELKNFNSAYRKGEPIISDRQYDNLIAELKKQHPNHEWFSRIEPSDIPETRKIKLPVQMKSLNKILSIQEFHGWVKSCGLRGIHKLVCMPKFDGGSLLVTESTQQGFSRGGEENEGQNCDLHVLKSEIITNNKFQYTFGEFIISVEDWEKHFKGQINPRSGQIYKAPRNVAVGMLNSDIPPQKISHATFFRYGISGWHPEYATFTEQIKDICDTYFQPHLYYTTEVKNISHDLLQSLYETWSKIYGIDGIVLYIDDLELSEKIGRNQSSGNPMYAIAYKGGFEEEVETEVLSVTVEVSKNGYLRPTVQIEPVSLSNSTISNPTGNNMRFITDNKIAAGSIIKIKRSGEVIPKIIGVTIPATEESMGDLLDTLSYCQSCGKPTQWNDTRTDIMCTNQECQGIQFAKLLHFYLTIGCDGLGKEIFSKLFDAGFNSISKMLSVTANDIIAIDRLGMSSAKTLIDLNQKIKEGLPMDLLIHASDCFVGIGRKKAVALLNKFEASNVNHLSILLIQSNICPADLSITEKAFYDGIPKFLDFIVENNLTALDVELQPEMNENGKFNGFSVCFTGVRDKDLEAYIISEGGSIASGISKKTTHLVVKDKNSSSSKTEKAKQLSIPIFEINEFKDHFIQ